MGSETDLRARRQRARMEKRGIQSVFFSQSAFIEPLTTRYCQDRSKVTGPDCTEGIREGFTKLEIQEGRELWGEQGEGDILGGRDGNC